MSEIMGKAAVVTGAGSGIGTVCRGAGPFAEPAALREA